MSKIYFLYQTFKILVASFSDGYISRGRINESQSMYTLSFSRHNQTAFQCDWTDLHSYSSARVFCFSTCSPTVGVSFPFYLFWWLCGIVTLWCWFASHQWQGSSSLFHIFFAIWLVMGKDLFKSFAHYFLWILSFFNTHFW